MLAKPAPIGQFVATRAGRVETQGSDDVILNEKGSGEPEPFCFNPTYPKRFA
jgi:hypothetical protein